MFSVGDKVICVDDSFDAETASYFSPLPMRGLIYCIRGTGVDVVDGSIAVWVCGIVGRLYIGGRERPLKGERFRKLSPRNGNQNIEVDVACLTR